jgi:glyoxylase-like metal-dependent hydrolase (beta-lactamase superfamily II)
MTLEGTNTYLVGRDPVVVIDPGPGEEGHIRAVRAAAEERGGVDAVVLTHSHPDHAESADQLGVPVIRPGDGERVGPLTAISTPGHAPDHVCLLAGTTCFSGDLILGEGSSVVPSADYGGSLADYLDSLRTLQALELTLIHPGHGPAIEDPAAKIEEYIEHRLMRERRLLAALDRGERSRSALLAEVWDDVPEQLRPAATVAMEAHLEKLVAEGRLPSDLVE